MAKVQEKSRKGNRKVKKVKILKHDVAFIF